MEACTKKQEVQNTKVKRHNLQRRQSMHEDSTEEEEMKRQQRMKVMKDMTKNIKAKGKMDANNSWWVSELLAADCEKARPQEGWEDTTQK